MYYLIFNDKKEITHNFRQTGSKILPMSIMTDSMIMCNIGDTFVPATNKVGDIDIPENAVITYELIV